MSRVVGIDARAALGQPTGVGRYVADLVRHMARLAPDCRFELFLDRASENLLPGAPGNISQRVLGMPALKNYFTWLQLRLPPSLLRRPVDLFHFPFYTLPVVRSCPTIVTIHDVTFERHPEWFSRRSRLATRRFARFAARRAAAVLTVSEHSRQDILACYGIEPEMVHVIHPAVDLHWIAGEVRPGAAARLGIPGPYVLHVGSIHTRRNLPRLLRSVALLREGGADLSVVMAGRVEYPYPDVGRMIHEAGLDGAAVHAGYLPDIEVRTLYREARALVYPSLYEGFGFPALEAMAVGTPAVASNTTCFPEVLGDAAILVDPEDTEALADGIRRACEDGTDRTALIQRGRDRVASYSWERSARQTLDVYDAVLDPVHA